MLQVFQRYAHIAYVGSGSSVSDVCCKCFDVDVAYVSHICCKSMFENVSFVSVLCCSKCFHVASCKCFYLDVAYILHVCCKCIVGFINPRSLMDRLPSRSSA